MTVKKAATPKAPTPKTPRAAKVAATKAVVPRKAVSGAVEKKTTTKLPARGGLGLEGLGGSLSGLLDATSKSDKREQSLDIPLSAIEEDGTQPRQKDNPGFSAESIAEIGVTIKARGVKSPISVRDNPEKPGMYIINHGARRYRGSKWAGKETIPAFVDNDYNDEDQVIENLQRNGLTAREIADYIGRKLAEGKKKSEIAKSLGKSPAFITQHVALLDLPDAIAQVFASGRVTDVTVVNELVTAHKSAPESVAAWLEDENLELTRGTVKTFREFLDTKRNDHEEDGRHQEEFERDPDTVDALTGVTDAEMTAGNNSEQEPETARKSPTVKKPSDPTMLKRSILNVTHDTRQARLEMDRRPSADGRGWIKYDDDGSVADVDLGEISIIALIEG